MNEMLRLANQDITTLDTATLHQRLANALTVTADGLYEAAAIWAELVRRGEPPHLRSGLVTWLPRIARRELAAEAVVAFSGQPSVLRQIIGMELNKQRDLAAGEEIEVATVAPDGVVSTARKPLARMTGREIMLALVDGTVRSPQDQVRRARMSSSAPATFRVTIRADQDANVLVIGRARVRPGDLKTALAELGYVLTKQP